MGRLRDFLHHRTDGHGLVDFCATDFALPADCRVGGCASTENRAGAVTPRYTNTKDQAPAEQYG